MDIHVTRAPHTEANAQLSGRLSMYRDIIPLKYLGQIVDLVMVNNFVKFEDNQFNGKVVKGKNLLFRVCRGHNLGKKPERVMALIQTVALCDDEQCIKFEDNS